jgi:hypothetical protein
MSRTGGIARERGVFHNWFANDKEAVMSKEKELVIRTLPSQNGPVRVVLSLDDAVVENDFIAAQCEQSGEVWRYRSDKTGMVIREGGDK